MQLQQTYISRWSGKPIRPPRAPKISSTNNSHSGPSQMPATTHAAVNPAGLQWNPTAGPMPPPGPYFVVTPMCKNAAPRLPQQSCLDSSSSDGSSTTSGETTSHSICRRPSDVSVAPPLPGQDGRPSLQAAVAAQKLPSNVYPAAAEEAESTTPRISDMFSLL